MNHRVISWLGGASIALCSVSIHAQQAPPATPKPAAPSASPGAVESNWVTQCGSKTRQGAIECSVQQSVIKTDTRQVVTMFSVRIPADTRAPVMLIQLPLGLFLPAGVELQVDDNKALPLALQTCDAAGCYAGSSLSTELSEQLKRGKTLRVSFKDLSQNKIDIPMPLAGFAAAYDTIK